MDWLLSGREAPEHWPTGTSAPVRRGRLAIVGGAEAMNAILAIDADKDVVIAVLANLDPPAATNAADRLLPLLERLPRK